MFINSRFRQNFLNFVILVNSRSGQNFINFVVLMNSRLGQNFMNFAMLVNFDFFVFVGGLAMLEVSPSSP